MDKLFGIFLVAFIGGIYPLKETFGGRLKVRGQEFPEAGFFTEQELGFGLTCCIRGVGRILFQKGFEGSFLLVHLLQNQRQVFFSGKFLG